MKFSVEPWAPEYGVAAGTDMDETSAPPVLDVEVAAADWAPVTSDREPVETVLFVDGVRRVDANVWIAQDDGTALLGICASYAAGAVRTEEFINYFNR